MESSSSPSSRSEWASLDWKSAQQQVAYLLNRNGYEIYEERHLESHKRADVVVIRRLPQEIIFGVVEVKCYQRISRSIETNAMVQAIRYLNALYQEVHHNSKYGNRLKRYFCAVVFTNDYPSIDTHAADGYQQYFKMEQPVWPILIASSADSFLGRLNIHFPEFHRQAKLDEFL